MIEVVEEQVERGDALRQTALDDVPVGAGDDPREEVVRKNAFGPFLTAVDGEGDALVEEREISLMLAAPQLLGGELEELLVQTPVGSARLRASVEHLVEGALDAVAGERIRGDEGHGSKAKNGQDGQLWSLSLRRARHSPAACCARSGCSN